MNIGIYSVTNKNTGERYIGKSENLHKREVTHLWALRNNRHPSKPLQAAWNRGDGFVFEILELCDPEELNDKEKFWIEYFDSMNHGYNQSKGGVSTLGRVCTEETRQKISEANKGRVVSAEIIRKRVETLQRRLANDPDFAKQHHEKLSERLRGKPSWNKGKPCPESQKRLVSEKLKGRYISDEHREKLRALYSGEKSITAKLKEKDVVMIRYRFLCGERQCEILKDYTSVTPQTLYDICRGRRWKSVPMSKSELESLLILEG